jgi:hypothetical protein
MVSMHMKNVQNGGCTCPMHEFEDTVVPILISSPRVLVECSVFSRTIGQVLVNSAECHQHDYDVDRCTSIVEGHQVYYNVVSNESIIVPG